MKKKPCSFGMYSREAQSLAHSFQKNVGGFSHNRAGPDAQAGQAKIPSPQCWTSSASHFQWPVRGPSPALCFGSLHSRKKLNVGALISSRSCSSVHHKGRRPLGIGAGGGRSAASQRCQRRAEQAHATNPHYFSTLRSVRGSCPRPRSFGDLNRCSGTALESGLTQMVTRAARQRICFDRSRKRKRRVPS